MKRKEMSGGSDQPCSGRRQPQVSCNECRRSKRKCNRGNPCDSCVSRGIPCTGQSSTGRVIPPLSVGSDSEGSVKTRLRSLEHAVFGSGRQLGLPAEKSLLVNAHIEHQPRTENNHGDVSKHFGTSSVPQHRDVIEHVTGPQEPPWVITRQEILLLLKDFVNNPYHLLPFIHEATTRTLIDEFYTNLEQGNKVDPMHAALLLSIAATGASFFTGAGTGSYKFASVEDAVQASLTWRQSALAILDDYRRGASSRGTLEEAQARAILTYLIYNAEGCSARNIYLHSCSVAVAREISLHLVDLEGSVGVGQDDDMPTREIKRRVWWHIASTDWLLGMTGGPLDGTYAIQSRQMKVRYPRNVNDNDLSMYDDTFTFPLNIPTQASCFIQRIRLAEVCRQVMDAKTDVAASLDYKSALGLDRLFERLLSEFPPFFQLDGDDVSVNQQLSAPKYLALQRAMIQVGLHSRRARLHRPFLLQDAQDQRCQPCRDICLQSARNVLSISMGLLESSLALLAENAVMDRQQESVASTKRLGEPPVHRLGIFIAHSFTACTILAIYAGQNATSGASTDNNYTGTGKKTETHGELSRACRVLAAIGRESSIAADLVHGLTDVLRRYRLKDMVEHMGDAPYEASPVRAHEETARVVGLDTADASASTRNQVNQGPHDNSIDVNYGEFGLDLLWNNFSDPSSAPENWDEVFAGLETYYGPA